MAESDVLRRLADHRVVPVVVVDDAATAALLGRALRAGGLPLAEVTFRTSAAVAAIATLAESGLLVGAGTVIRPEQVDEAVGAGARFVVSPGLSERVVVRCRELDVPVIPGVATATEVVAALELGIEILKLFPAETVGGVAAVKALSAPFAQVRWIPTGGINAENAARYLALPSVAAVGGSWMVAPELVRSGDVAEVERRTAEAVRLAAETAS